MNQRQSGEPDGTAKRTGEEELRTHHGQARRREKGIKVRLFKD